MIHVQEHPIQCIDGKCIYMSKHSMNNDHNVENYQDIYGKNTSHRRFENLGVPIFVVQTQCFSDHDVQETSGNASNDTISDELFDLLFDKVETKKKQTMKTSKTQRKHVKNISKKNKKKL